jgi:hypothetical protein
VIAVFMTRKAMFARACALLLFGGLAACGDQLPTVTGEEQFPRGARATTLELELAATGTIEELGVFSGYFDPREAPFLVAANRMGGALDAHVLVELAEFPEMITIGTAAYQDIEFTGAEFFVTIDTIATPAEAVGVELWTVDQEWHFGSMSWTMAVDTAGARESWQIPGGTRRELIGVSAWEPRDTAHARADTVGWMLTGEQINALRDEEVRGLLLRPATAGTRLQVATLGLRVDILVRRDAADASRDTTVVRNVSGLAGFVFDPPAPTPDPAGADGWWAGGVTGARTLLRITLPDSVPGCAPPAVCAAVALRDVSLTEAILLLDPLAMPGGFQPLAPVRLALRRLSEPELGRLAPLGQTIGEQLIEAADFASGDAVFGIRFTNQMAQLLQRDTTTLAVALMARSEGTNFGFARFAGIDPDGRDGRRPPRVRLTYTIPGRQALP